MRDIGDHVTILESITNVFTSEQLTVSLPFHKEKRKMMTH